MKNKKYTLTGAAAGFLNGLFGSGGGIIAVPLLERSGEEPKKAHAESIALMLPLSVVSSVYYLIRGNFFRTDMLTLIPFGLIGAFIGAKFMKKISPNILKKLFGILLIAAGVRTFLP